MPNHTADGIRCQGCDKRAGHGHIFDCPVRIRALEVDAERWRDALDDADRLGALLTEAVREDYGAPSWRERVLAALRRTPGIDLPPDPDEGRRLADDLPGSY